ncbi:(2Fe-2S)-binding protein [Nonomuraea salmonea]|uniref:(2Fe-2S)-binding protein n=1 Tax=Nonomuraea salmonea TaxID=46181 RepID=UPI0031E69EF8
MPGDVRLLWVLRDVLGVTGPKYGCGINVCKACTSHVNGKAVSPCSVPVSELRPGDEVTTIEGLAGDDGLHPMQQAWIDHDVSQCGYCQPGQIMAAVDLVRRVAAEGRAITDDDLDGIRNICRCGTYPPHPAGDQSRRRAHVSARQTSRTPPRQTPATSGTPGR